MKSRLFNADHNDDPENVLSDSEVDIFPLHVFDHSVAYEQTLSALTSENIVIRNTLYGEPHLSATREGVVYHYYCFYDQVKDGQYSEEIPCSSGQVAGFQFNLNDQDIGTIYWNPGAFMSYGDNVDVTLVSISENGEQKNRLNYYKHHPPIFANVYNQIITSGHSIILDFDLTDADSTLDCTTALSMTSSNQALIGNNDVVFGNVAPGVCNATLTTDPGETGSSQIIFTATDGYVEGQALFTLTKGAGGCSDSSWTFKANINSNDPDVTLKFAYSAPSFNIDWGDGNVESIPNNISLVHSYASTGEYTVSVTGCLQNITSINLSQVDIDLEDVLTYRTQSSLLEKDHNAQIENYEANVSTNLKSRFKEVSLDFSPFPNLENLILKSVDLTGNPLPSNAFSNNPSLSYIDFSGCMLAGNIPTGVFDNLSLLTFLDLSYNLLSNLVDATLLNNTALVTLGLESNQFSLGNISNIFQPLTNLRVLNMRNAGWSGVVNPNSFSTLTNLELLDFSNNSVTGDLPANLFQANTQLNYLDFSGNNLGAGASNNFPLNLFANLGNLLALKFSADGWGMGQALTSVLFQDNINLTHIHFRGNDSSKFSGDLDTINLFDNLSQLKHLNIGANAFTGVISDNGFGTNTNLESLTFDNNLIGPALEANLMDEMLNLELLDFAGNNISNIGLLDEFFAPVVNLKYLDFNNNNFSGSIPATTFANNTALQTLNFGGNQFSGSIPVNLFSGLVYLEELGFGVNQFSGGIPSLIFDEQVSLVRLDFGRNQFSGAIPSLLFSNLSELKSLQMNDNSFNGSIPANLFVNNTKLEVLTFGRNDFSGNIPSNLFSGLSFLSDVRGGGNAFSGTIPSTLFSSNNNLKQASFFNAGFSGALATNLFPSGIETIVLSDNNLNAGTSLSAFSSLKTFKVDGNQFSTTDVNNFLIDLESNNAPGSSSPGLGFQFQGQTPVAPPSGAGLAAKNNMIANGLNVLTD